MGGRVAAFGGRGLRGIRWNCSGTGFRRVAGLSFKESTGDDVPEEPVESRLGLCAPGPEGLVSTDVATLVCRGVAHGVIFCPALFTTRSFPFSLRGLSELIAGGLFSVTTTLVGYFGGTGWGDGAPIVVAPAGAGAGAAAAAAASSAARLRSSSIYALFGLLLSVFG